MKKRVLSALLALCMVLSLLPTMASATTQITGNLIVDPGGEVVAGFETRLNQNGWTEGITPERGYSYTEFADGTAYTSGIVLAPHSGSYFMGFYNPLLDSGATGAISATCYQDIDITGISDYETGTYSFSGWFSFASYMDNPQSTTEYATVSIRQLDANGNEIANTRASQNALVNTSTADGWDSFTVSGSVNASAKKFRVAISANLTSAGLAAFDDLSLTLITTTVPATAADVHSAKALAEVLNAISSGCCVLDGNKVTMQQNVKLPETINITGGTIVLDLNGHTITGADGKNGSYPVSSYGDCAGKNAIAVTGGMFTLTDSGTGGKLIGGNGNGTWTTGPAGGHGLYANGGTVTISGGTMQGGNGCDGTLDRGADGSGIDVQSGMVSITGGQGGAQVSGVVINGGSVLASALGVTPKNGSGTDVQLYTLTVAAEDLTPLADTAVDTLSATDALGYDYGMTHVKTDAGGKLYVYLPAGKTAVSVTVGGVAYSGSVTNHAATLAPAHVHCVCGGSVNAGDHTSHSAGLSYQPLPSDYTGGPLEGSYYLAKDTSLANTLYVAAGTTLNLCLNGHKLTAAAEYSDAATSVSYAGVINNCGTLNLCDCTSGTSYGKWDSSYSAYTIGTAKPSSGVYDTLTGGVVTGWASAAEGGGIVNDGALNIYGGSVAGNQGGGVESWSGSTLTLYGGVIAGNRLTGVPDQEDNTGGAGIYAQDAAVTMYGGRVSGNAALTDQNNSGGDGGGVYVTNTANLSPSSFNMTGGSIEGNSAAAIGGGVCFDGSSSFTMTGGSITGNRAMAGGGICANNTFSLSGNVTISGNSATVMGADLLLFPMEENTPKINISAALTNTTPIGVSVLGADEDGKPVYAGGVFTTGSTVTNSDYLANFASESADFAMRAAADNQLRLAPISAIEKASATHGVFTVTSGGSEATKAAAGDTVTVTPAADSGYALSKISVTKTGDANTAVTVANGAFTMPAYPVTVSAIFKTITAAPGAPTIGTGENQPTDTSITINTAAGQEYVISTSADAPESWSGENYFKAAENGTHTFTGLTPAVKYYIHNRTAETDTAMPSDSAAAGQYTLPTAPEAGVVVIDYAAETVSFDSRYEVSTQNDGNGTAVVSAITPGAEAQTVYVRVKAVSGGAPASAWTAVTIPARPAVGAALAADNAAETVTVPAGYSYRIGSGSAVGVSADTAVTLAPGAALTYWKTATASAFRSDSAAVSAPARLAAPGAPAVDGNAKTLATTAAMQYKTDSGNWTDCTADMALSAFGWAEGTALHFQLRLAATGDNYASVPITIILPPHVTAPAAGKTDETIRGRADGALTGLDDTMEYRLSDDTAWTAVDGTSVTGLAAGTYKVRYAAGVDYAASDAVTLTIAAGRKLKVTLPETQTGYTLTADKAEFDWQEAVVLTYTLEPGYTQLSNFAVAVNGSAVTLDAQGKATVAAPENDLTVTVTGVADVTAPTGEIAVGENKWTSFLNTVTFGLFFRETQTVTVTAADAGSGTAKAEYLLSDTVFTGAEQVDGTWNSLALDSEGKGSFDIAPNSRQFVYVRLTDAAGNFVILNSEGIVLYTSAALGVTAAEFNPDKQADIAIPLTLNDNTLTAVKNGENTLSEGTDYTLSGGTLTVGKAYLASALTGDSLKLTLSFVPMGVETDKVAMTAEFTVTKHIHTWDGGVITTRPTISAEGVMTYTCTTCGVTKTEKVEKLASSQQTIPDGTEKATVSGVLTEGAKLIIAPISGGSGYDALIKLVNTDQNEVIGAYEATITGQYLGKLILTFTVDAKYNGKTLTIYHEKKDGTVETFTQTASGGKVSVTVDELSPFLLTAVKGAGSAARTGDNSSAALWFALLFVSGGVLTAFGSQRKRKRSGRFSR